MDSRPALGWTDLRSTRVGVWGLGIEGRASLARLDQLGAEVVIVDDNPALGEYAGHRVVLFGAGGNDALAGCDAVVKAPGISRYREDVKALVEQGVAVVGGLGLWLAEAPPDRVVGITGTKGKSTTAAVLGHLLNRLGQRCLVAGNVGRPPWDPNVPTGVDRWVLEISSFQATDLTTTPPVMAITSLHPDHLDWHGSVDRYYADKLSACTQPGAALTVAADTPELRQQQDRLGPEIRWVTANETGGGAGPHWTEPLGLLGSHNRRNAELARACLEAGGEAAASRPERLAELASGFVPLPSRLQPVERIGEVDFVDDSLSTNALATMAALDAFADRRVALLVGGYDRGIDYSPLAHHVAGRSEPVLVIPLPDNGPRIASDIRIADTEGSVELTGTRDIEVATRAGFDWAGPGGVVLLSPAAPSFGRYRDYADRGRAFAAAAAACRSDR